LTARHRRFPDFPHGERVRQSVAAGGLLGGITADLPIYGRGP
jgi:chorismate synthase